MHQNRAMLFCFMLTFLWINIFSFSLSNPVRIGREAFCAEKPVLDSAEKQSVDYLNRLPYEAVMHFRYGLKQVMRNQIDAGINDYLAAIKIAPKNPALYDQLSIAYDKKGNLQKAIEASLKALEIDPGYSYAHLGLAVLYDKTGKIDSARKHAAEHLRLTPDSREKNACLAIINR